MIGRGKMLMSDSYEDIGISHEATCWFIVAFFYSARHCMKISYEWNEGIMMIDEWIEVIAIIDE